MSTISVQILDFEIADSEQESNCLALLNRLHLRGVTDAAVQLIVSDGAGGICAAVETVYPTTARQRCVFHKLRNVGDSVRDKGNRKAILEAACWIYTTNALEGGVMRPLRRTLDRATAYHSEVGATVGVFLAIMRLNAHQRDQPWAHETDDLITMLYNVRP